VDITMEDSGPGIPEKNREKVLQSFFTTKVKGTGLGLTIVQRVLRNHGGEILFEHPARGGTKVILRLPVRQTMEVNEQDGEGRALSAEGRGQRVWGRWQRT
jgi:signal transduction histidine kinase